MNVSLAFGVAGLIASGLKAFVSTDQANISKKSIADVVIGGAVGVLYPLFPVIPIPETASVLQQAVLVGVVSYFSSDLLTGILAKLGVAPSAASLTTGQVPPPPK